MHFFDANVRQLGDLVEFKKNTNVTTVVLSRVNKVTVNLDSAALTLNVFQMEINSA